MSLAGAPPYERARSEKVLPDDICCVWLPYKKAWAAFLVQKIKHTVLTSLKQQLLGLSCCLPFLVGRDKVMQGGV